MKTISAALKAHLAQEVTTVATCMLVTRLDGAVFGFTDHSQDLLVSGVTYLASTGYTQSAIKTTSALNVDNLETVAWLDASSITDADMLAGLWDYAQVEIFLVNYADLTMGTMQLRKGWLGQINTGRTAFSAELRGMMQPLQQDVGRIYTASCDADLGDARCGVNLVTFTVTGTVTSVTSQAAFADSSRTEADGLFQYAKLTWTGGLNAGLSMEVKSYMQAGGVFSLQQSMPYAVTVGDAYSVYSGCDKQRSTCVATFNNVVNFRGFPDVPGQDRMVSGK